jgi:hypothetical protein
MQQSPDLVVFEVLDAGVDELAGEFQHFRIVHRRGNGDGLGVECDLHASEDRIGERQAGAFCFEGFFEYADKVSLLLLCV